MPVTAQIESTNVVEHQLRAELAVLGVRLDLEGAVARALIGTAALHEGERAGLRARRHIGLLCVDEWDVRRGRVIRRESALVEVELADRAGAGEGGDAVAATCCQSERLRRVVSMVIYNGELKKWMHQEVGRGAGARRDQVKDGHVRARDGERPCQNGERGEQDACFQEVHVC